MSADLTPRERCLLVERVRERPEYQERQRRPEPVDRIAVAELLLALGMVTLALGIVLAVVAGLVRRGWELVAAGALGVAAGGALWLLLRIGGW